MNDPVSRVPRTFNELASRAKDMAFVLETDEGDIFPDADNADNDD